MVVDYETEQVSTWIGNWIKGCFERSKVTAFELRRWSPADGDFERSAISEWADFENQNVDELAAAIFAEARKDADTDTEGLRYALFAFREEEPELPFARSSFRLFGGSVPAASEAPVTTRMKHHLVGLIGCLAEATGRVLRGIGANAKTLSEDA